MSFVCPECARPELEITLSIELPPDARSDEITLQTVECSRCGFQGAAVYEESRRGALDSESWHHQGHRLEKEPLRALVEAIRACPDRRNRGCRCASHRGLGRTDASGRWVGVPESTQTFPMRAGSDAA